MIFQETILLSNYTTFKIGGPARYFCNVSTLTELKEAFLFAGQKDLDFFILAGGSNLIVSDNGYAGLVIKIDFQGIHFENNLVILGSGMIVDKVVDLTVEKGLGGLEWAGGLPGTIGGAVRGNAGAFLGEMKDIIQTVKSILPSGEIVERTQAECQFGYRTSIFKNNKEVILEVKLLLKSANSSDLKKVAEDHREYRRTRHPMELPNTGSIFKNVSVENIPENYLDKFADAQKNDPFPIIPTARILSDAGLKGYTVGQAQISIKHPNYIVNLGQAKAEEVVSVIQYAIAIVMDKFGIQLEVEPQLLGFNQHYPWESK